MRIEGEFFCDILGYLQLRFGQLAASAVVRKFTYRLAAAQTHQWPLDVDLQCTLSGPRPILMAVMMSAVHKWKSLRGWPHLVNRCVILQTQPNQRHTEKILNKCFVWLKKYEYILKVALGIIKILF